MLALEKQLVVSISLNNYTTLKNRKRKNIYPFWEHFISAENDRRKNKNSEDFLLITKQVFSHRNLENFSGEYER